MPPSDAQCAGRHVHQKQIPDSVVVARPDTYPRHVTQARNPGTFPGGDPGGEEGGEEGGWLGARGGGMGGMGRSDDNTVKGIGGVFDFVYSVTIVGLEADLSAVGPRALNPGVIGEGAEGGMVGGGQIFEDGEAVTYTMSGHVRELGESILLVAKYDVAD
jgi:hypothetical protein